MGDGGGSPRAPKRPEINKKGLGEVKFGDGEFLSRVNSSSISSGNTFQISFTSSKLLHEDIILLEDNMCSCLRANSSQLFQQLGTKNKFKFQKIGFRKIVHSKKRTSENCPFGISPSEKCHVTLF